VLVAVLGATWAWRLALHLQRRLAGAPEDGRYQRMRKAMGKWADLGFLVFFQVQAVFTLIFGLPFLVAAASPVGGLQVTDVLGVLVWLVAVGGEWTADRQLERWRNEPANKGRTCRAGLWAWSRHPNYFFEWVHWFAYVLIAFGSPWWWASFWGPVVMLVFLFKLTGIPWTEARALESRGADYRKYQREVCVFFPLPPRQAR
jgi:steroid 5-alpha reductase family enzyme